MKNKLLSFLLCISLMLCCLPSGAIAQEDGSTPDTADFQMQLLNIPDGLFILEGMEPDISQWQIQLIYEDGQETTVPVTQEMVTFPTSADQHQATITYLEKSLSFACRFISLEGASLEITSLPDKTVYIQGEEFSDEGMELVLCSGADFRQIVTGFTVSGFDPQLMGAQQLTVAYGALTAQLEVQVKSPIPDNITSPVFSIQDGFLTGVDLGSTADILLAGLDAPEHIQIKNGEAEVLPEDILSTGMTLNLMDGDTVKETITLVILGDINEDGQITITDMISIKRHILDISILEGAQAMAADYNGDGNITVTDFVQLKAYILK